MDRKTFTIVMAVALIAGFFIPSGGTSMFELVTSKVGDWQKYLWLIIPVCGLFLLLGEFNNSYSGNRGLLTWLPLLTLLYFLVVRPLMDKIDLGSVFRNLGIGMWIMIVASVLLAFYNPRPR